uniref:uncharacterized protein LOC122609164 n=1 Tax=Erigeron canadensis TaxID=72917 RepID=UPI001CB9648B|nr:uncharacterized protein LOC122609164 [Erigeron canadensis]
MLFIKGKGVIGKKQRLNRLIGNPIAHASACFGKLHRLILADATERWEHEPMFDDEVFRTRYHMSKRLILKIVEDITASFPWFRSSANATGVLGNSKVHVRATLYGEEYLRSLTSHDVARLYEAHEARHHFPGMIGSIYCTHWTWRNCLHSLRGQYHRCDHEHPTIILEAVASYDLWFWHAYFGVAESNNDINDLKQSPLFIPEVNEKFPEYPFTVNSHRYNRGFYPGDGIYPHWSCFLKAYAYPFARKEKVMKKLQESARKDVERAFRILIYKWAIIERPTQMKNKEKIVNIMYACVILHNMILKEDGNTISPVYIMDPPNDLRVTDPNFLYHLRNEETHYVTS